MWAQTYYSGNQYYREQRGSRGAGCCVNQSRSLPCHVPSVHPGRIVGAIILPDAWQDRLLAQVKVAKDIRRVGKERKEAEQRLRRLGQVYLDGLIEQEEYRRQKRDLDEKLRTLVIPEVDAATAAGELVENLPALWERANLSEKRKILMTMLDGVYVDTVENKAIVALRPKPAFRALFQIATTRDGSGVVLYKENPPNQFPSPEDDSPCSWWRRGRVEVPVQIRSIMLN